jgi:hypothetical protein
VRPFEVLWIIHDVVQAAKDGGVFWNDVISNCDVFCSVMG